MTRQEIDELVRAVARADLDGGVGPIAAAPLDGPEWQQLTAAVRRQRLEPQLARAASAGLLPATTAQLDEARSAHAVAMATALLLDRQLITTCGALADAEVECVVLKGSATAHLDYPDPAQRAYGDVDLLVAPDEIERAEMVLGRAGGVRRFDEPRPGFDRRFGKGASFRMPSRLEVDLHRTLTLGPFGLAIDLGELRAGTEPFTVGDTAVRALDRPRRFLHACYHAVLGRAQPRLVPLMDVVHTAPADVSELEEARRLAHRWRADVVIRAATAAAVDRLGWEIPPDLSRGLRSLDPTRTERRWFAGYSGGRRSSAWLTVTAVEAIDGWSDRAQYLRSVIWPSRLTVSEAVRRLGRGVEAIRHRH